LSAIESFVFNSAIGNSEGIIINTSTLTLEKNAFIGTTTLGQGDAGLIQITADNITLKGQSRQGFASNIESEVGDTAVGDSKGIIINTSTLTLDNGGKISTSTFGEGDAGNISIVAEEQISLSDTVFNETLNREIGGIFAFTQTIGNAGNITIDTPQLTISEGAGIEAFTSGEGSAGDITINAPTSIILNTDTRLITESSSTGTAGDININTPLLTIGEDAQLSATATATSTAERAGNINLNINQLNISGELGIFAETQSTPTAGSLTIQPYQTNPNLNIQFTENGFISARTTDIGDGGNIIITAPNNIDIRGQGSITAETSGEGDAGNINIDTQTLTIADGTNITTSTESLGNAGIITLDATESLFLTNQAQISSEVRTGAQGNSQGIIINTPFLTLNNNARISAATQGLGNAGNIDIFNAETITIDNNSLLNVQTDSRGIAGNINLTTDTLTIGKDSELSARSTSNATGRAGNVNIKADFLNITGELGIFAETNGIADAGNLNINPNETLNLAITFFDG
jgi:large exoprotein involved in heme utilization and adhesion